MVFVKTYKRYFITVGVIWAACFVLLLFVYLIVLGPQKNNKKHIENTLAEKKQVYELAQRAAREETKIQFNEQLERLQSRLKDFVIDFEDSANLTFDISQIADEKKVTSFSIKSKGNRGLSAIPGCNNIFENHIVISFIGNFNQFATFLNALERHRPVLFVDKFAITHSGQDESTYRVTLNVASFVRKQRDVKTADKGPEQVYGTEI